MYRPMHNIGTYRDQLYRGARYLHRDSLGLLRGEHPADRLTHLLRPSAFACFSDKVVARVVTYKDAYGIGVRRAGQSVAQDRVWMIWRLDVSPSLIGFPTSY